MGPPRRFDHDDARRRYAAGERVADLADEYGVTTTAVYLAVNDEYRAREAARHDEWQRSGVCADCGAPCTRREGGRCRPCASRHSASTVRDGELACVTCHQWKPDRAFPYNRANPVRRDRHRQCRACNTAAKKAWRERNKVPCSHGCGTLVFHERRDPNKPPECGPCARRRIFGQPQALAAEGRR